MYVIGVGHYVGDVLRGEHRLAAVRARRRNFYVIGKDAWEALVVGDMPINETC